LGNTGEPETYSYTDLALSPDGTRLAATRIDPKVAGEGDIWLLDLIRGVSTRFTFDLTPDSSPVWSPDGTRVAFAAVRAGGNGIYQKAANGSGKEEELVHATGDPKLPDGCGDHRSGFLPFAKVGLEDAERSCGVRSATEDTE
jgi:dipeptidyl aminopeptidase/acylaminoacyl peptidase